jgi:hypothetical protein
MYHIFALFYLLGGLSMDFVFDSPILSLLFIHFRQSPDSFKQLVHEFPEFVQGFRSTVPATVGIYQSAFGYYKKSMPSFIAKYIFPVCVVAVVIGMIQHVMRFRSVNSVLCLILTVVGVAIYVIVEGNVEQELPMIPEYNARSSVLIHELLIKVALGHFLLSAMIILALFLLLSDYYRTSSPKKKGSSKSKQS